MTIKALKMSVFFAILVGLNPLIAGGVSVHDTDQVKREQKWFLVENKSGSENILRKLDIFEASADCKQLYPEILRYCSPEEQKSGCVNKNGSTFLLEFEKSGVSLTPLLNARDGCYVARYTYSNNSIGEKVFKVNGQLPVSKDGKLLVGLGIGGVLAAVGIAVCFISCLCRKKKKNRDSKKDSKNSHRKGNNEAKGVKGSSHMSPLSSKSSCCISVDSSPSSSSEEVKKKRTMKRKGKGKK